MRARKSWLRLTVLPWILWGIVIGLTFGMAMYAACARAEPVFFDCAQLASTVGWAADFRDTGGDPVKVMALLRRRNPGMGAAHLAALEREVRRVWLERQPRREALETAFERCRAQLGDMGRES